MTKHRKQKVKVIYKHIKEESGINEAEAKKEIAELEEKRRQIETSSNSGIRAKFGNFLQRANINTQINQRRQAIAAKYQIKNIKSKIEMEKAKEELNSLRKKNQIDFNSLGVKENYW